MNPIAFLSLVIILSAALPWWPYSASGRLRHHRPWDWLLDTPSAERKPSIRRVGRGPTPEASQKAAMKLCDGNSETHLMQGDATLQSQLDTLLRQFEERWVAQEISNRSV
jgi:hypothetical protein